jgi:hypothetical protein
MRFNSFIFLIKRLVIIRMIGKSLILDMNPNHQILIKYLKMTSLELLFEHVIEFVPMF